MNKITRIIYCAIAIVMCIGMIPSSLVMASEVKLNKTNLYLAQGASYTLKVKETTKTVKWSSDNKKIATVEDTGKVKAVATGKATITAKVGGTSYKCSLTVVNKLNAKDFVFNVKGKKSDFIKETSNLKNPGWKYFNAENISKHEKMRGIKLGDSVSTVIKKLGETKAEVLVEDSFYCLPYSYKKGNDTYWALFYYGSDKVIEHYTFMKNLVNKPDKGVSERYEASYEGYYIAYTE